MPVDNSALPRQMRAIAGDGEKVSHAVECPARPGFLTPANRDRQGADFLWRKSVDVCPLPDGRGSQLPTTAGKDAPAASSKPDKSAPPAPPAPIHAASSSRKSPTANPHEPSMPPAAHPSRQSKTPGPAPRVRLCPPAPQTPPNSSRGPQDPKTPYGPRGAVPTGQTALDRSPASRICKNVLTVLCILPPGHSHGHLGTFRCRRERSSQKPNYINHLK